MANKNNFVISKTGKRYWLERVYRPRIIRAGGKVDLSPYYAVRLSHSGRRMTLTLSTPSQNAAAELAREMYVYLSASGWPAFLAKYRNPTGPEPEPTAAPALKTGLTVGEFLAAVRTDTELEEKTISDYARCLRLIVGQVCAIKGTKKRFDYRRGGTKAWQAKINAIALADLKPEDVQGWKKWFVARAGRD